MNHPRISVVAALIVVAMMLPVAARAQDAQYWTQRYGTASRLLGGAVIGNVKDLSAGFYNPGAIVLVEGAKFVLSARVLQLQIITLDNPSTQVGAGTTWSVNPAPSFFAGMLTLDEEKPNQFGYIYLARQQFRLRIDAQVVEDRDVITGAPGDESFAGSVLFDEDLSEYWGGLMWSRRVRDNVGIGATGFVAYRGQRIRSETVAQAYTVAGDVAQAKVIRDFSYYNWRTLAKLGITYEAQPLTLGLSLTTPSTNLFGQGSSFIDIATSGDVDGDGANDDVFIADLNKDAKSKYPSSWAIGVGAAYQFEHTDVTASAEWYAAIDQFDILEPDTFVAQSTGQPLPNRVTAELKSVLNWGVGVEHRFTEDVAIYGSFTTDFSAAVPTATNAAIAVWDIYHLTGGAEFSIRNIHLTGGIEWGFGREPVRGLDLSDVDGSNGLTRTGDAEVTYNRLTFILGIAIGGSKG
jgi:hypothetical protein